MTIEGVSKSRRGSGPQGPSPEAQRFTNVLVKFAKQLGGLASQGRLDASAIAMARRTLDVVERQLDLNEKISGQERTTLRAQVRRFRRQLDKVAEEQSPRSVQQLALELLDHVLDRARSRGTNRRRPGHRARAAHERHGAGRPQGPANGGRDATQVANRSAPASLLRSASTPNDPRRLYEQYEQHLRRAARSGESLDPTLRDTVHQFILLRRGQIERSGEAFPGERVRLMALQQQLLQTAGAEPGEPTGRAEGLSGSGRAGEATTTRPITSRELHEAIASTDVTSVRRDGDHGPRRHRRLTRAIGLFTRGLRAWADRADGTLLPNFRFELVGLFFENSRTLNPENMRLLGQMSRDEVRFAFRVAAERAGLEMSPREVDELVQQFLLDVGQRVDYAVRQEAAEAMLRGASELVRRGTGPGAVEWATTPAGVRFLRQAVAADLPGASALLRDLDRLRELTERGADPTRIAELRGHVKERLGRLVREADRRMRESATKLLEDGAGATLWSAASQQFPRLRQTVLEKMGARGGSFLDVSMDAVQKDIQEREKAASRQLAIVMALNPASLVGGGVAVALASAGFEVARNYFQDSVKVEEKERLARLAEAAGMAGLYDEAQVEQAQVEAEQARIQRNVNVAVGVASGAMSVAGAAGRGVKAAGRRAEDAAEAAMAAERAGVPLNRATRLAARAILAVKRQREALEDTLGEGTRKVLGTLWKLVKAEHKTRARDGTFLGYLRLSDDAKAEFARSLGRLGERRERLGAALATVLYLREHDVDPRQGAEIGRELLSQFNRDALTVEEKALYDQLLREVRGFERDISEGRQQTSRQARPSPTPHPAQRA